MCTNKGFELGDYPPPAYVHNTHTLAKDSQPSSSLPSIAKGQADIFQASSSHASQTPSLLKSSTRPPLIRTNASENIHNRSTYPDPGVGNVSKGPVSLYSRLRNFIIIWLLNVPFLIVFIMDIVGTFIFPTSALYRNIVYTQTWFWVTLGISSVTGAIFNAYWLIEQRNRYQFSMRRRYGNKDLRPNHWGKIWWFKIFIASICVIIWPYIATSIHRSIYPTYPSCSERGFGSSLKMSVVKGTSDTLWSKPLFMNNVTIESGEGVVGFNLSPSIPQARDIDKFYLIPNEILTSPGLFAKVQGTKVMMSLNKKAYEFHNTPLAPDGILHRENMSNGIFSDKEDFYLSFPSLDIRSVTKMNWSHVGERPSVVLVDDKRVILQSVEKHPKDNENLVFRMCAPWSIQEMVDDRSAMEKVLVPLTRVGVEMALWGVEK